MRGTFSGGSITKKKIMNKRGKVENVDPNNLVAVPGQCH
jgi:hypothetical protein